MGYNTTSDLTDEEAQYIEARLIEGHMEKIVGRTIFPTIPVPAGKTEYTWNEIEEMAEAELIPELGEFPMDKVSRDKTTIYVEKYGKKYGISREEILAARENGYELEARSAASCGRAIGKKEEKVIWTAVETATSNASLSALTPGTAWDASGNDPADDICDWMATFAELDSDDKWFDLTDIVLEPSYYYPLFKTNDYGIQPITAIREMGVNVTMAHLDGIATTDVNGFAFDRNFAAIIEAEPITSEGEYRMSNQAYIDQAYERVGVAVFEPEAFRVVNVES